MMELIGLSLLIVVLIIVWIFFNREAVKVEKSKSKALNSMVTKNKNRVEEIKSAYVDKKNQLDRVVDESIICRHQLLQKSNSLIKKSDELSRVKNKLVESNNKLLTEIIRLGSIIKENERAIRTFKCKSDEFSDDIYMHISKDQFTQIENKLKEHKSRVDILENENSKLMAQQRLKKEPRLLEDMKLYISNLR